MELGAKAPEPDDNHLFNAIVAGIDGEKLERGAREPEPQTHEIVPDPAEAPEPPQEQQKLVDQLADDEQKEEDEFGMTVRVNRPEAVTVPQVQPVVPKRTVRDAVVDWIDRRQRSKVVAAADEISTGAFVTISVMTLLVASLAFILSFVMMVEPAKRYGWSDDMATLFPIIIDVGAIGGTFMGAISANRVYRVTGHQILFVTLAASVLFNLVGHDIKGAERAMGLPDRYHWTGYVAAVLVPMLLAYFIHAFAKALKEFVDQRRAKRIAAQQLEAAERAAEAAERAARRKERDAVTARPAPARIQAPSPAAIPAQSSTAATAVNEAVGKPKKATKEIAVPFGVENGVNTPAKLRDALLKAGYELPSSSTTVETWCKEIKQAQNAV